MDWLEAATELAKKYEGCKLDAYPDPASGGAPWTIGYGATGQGIARGVTWTQEQAEADLRARFKVCGAQVDALVTVPLSTGQKAALADFVYNLGSGALRSSTLLRVLNVENYTAAAAEFAVWNRAAGRVMPGLVHRRAAEQLLFLFLS